MLRTRIAFIATATLVATLLVLVPALAIAGSVSVTATFVIAPSVSAEVVDGGLVVYSTVPWQLVAEVAGPEGETRRIHESGERTGGSGVYVEAPDLIGYSLVPETTR